MSELNEEQKKEYLSSGFHQYLIITLNNTNQIPDNNFVNVVITLDDLDYNENAGLGALSEYVNQEFSNFLFTPHNDFNTIYQYEYYQGAFFIKMIPFSNKIAMHILPKKYSGFKNGDVLLFKDSSINPIKHSYYAKHDSPNINLYYQYKNEDDDPQDRILELNAPKFSKFSNRKVYYNYDNNEWVEEPYEDIYGEFDFDISNKSSNLDCIQINAGYKYNTATSDKNVIHYTGIYDNHSIGSQKAVLIDANYDAENTDYSNVITQLEWDNNQNKLSFPQTEAIAYQDKGFNNTHLGNIGKTFHKTIKYWNDTIFISEKKDNKNQVDDYKIADWTDPDEVD